LQLYGIIETCNYMVPSKRATIWYHRNVQRYGTIETCKAMVQSKLAKMKLVSQLRSQMMEISQIVAKMLSRSSENRPCLVDV